ncbi:MAG: DUF4139 domain-containing protein [Flavobacteriales bacterium]|nr:DUF4139 domain-containing protein [Flavobacteriales bacterium]
MKKLLAICILLAVHNSISQTINEIEINSKVNEVSVFIEGAQIKRNKSVNLKSGINLLKFINLSPFIEAKSIQLKTSKNVTVLSVNHQQNFINKLEKPKNLLAIEKELESLKDELETEKTYLSILSSEIQFLNDNKKIGGTSQNLSVNDLKTTAEFYANKLTALKLKELERNKKLTLLLEKEKDLNNELLSISGKKDFANGEILIKLETKTPILTDLELTYVVGNAGWLQSYDIRAKDVNEPVELIYKAIVKQDTKINWDNVKLRLSSANPNLSGVAPELRIYFLDYYSVPPQYNRDINEVSGVVLGSGNAPLPGVNIMVEGSTIGTTTNFDGFYSIALPNSASTLVYSYLGYVSKSINVSRAVQNVYLEEDTSQLDEVVVVGYGSKKRGSLSKELERKVSGVNIKGAASNNIIPLEQLENQTTVDFQINIPYTINSDNKSYSVDMIQYKLPATYQYYSVPKIEKEAFLIASINNWEQYNLLEGEANIFFENTFVGKTILDVRYVSDTLDISLGRDKNVSVNREKVSDFTSKKFVGSKKEDARAWNISVKNNKSNLINMIVLDQVPVSKLEEIKVDVLELSKGKYNTETGEVKWEFDLKPNEQTKRTLKYVVKYPKNKSLVIE